MRGRSPTYRTLGVWDNSTNPNNVMKYEPYEKDGSQLAVSNPSNPSQNWSYVTLFDASIDRFRARKAPRRQSKSSTPKSLRGTTTHYA
jgi:hypothetical protein